MTNLKALLFLVAAAAPMFVVLRGTLVEEPDWTMNVCLVITSFMFAQIWIAAILSRMGK